MALSVDIEKHLGAFHLRVGFETDRTMLALLGASGSGKSVCLRCIAGLMQPDRGRIVLNGRVLFDSEAGIDLKPQARRVGYLFQSFALFPNMNVRRNVEAGLHRLPRKERRAAAKRLLASLRISHLAEKLPAQLSGGERQRTALARILASEPELLLLDEPFSALDEYLRWQVELELTDSLKQYGGDVILVSHSRDEVCRLAGSVCVLNRGRSEPLLPVGELMRTPGTVSAALLSGCKNISAAEAGDDGLLASDWGWPLAGTLPAGVTHLGIRAHHIGLGPGPNPLQVRVSRIIDNVFSWVVMVRTPGGGQLRLELAREVPLPAEGETVTVHAESEAVMLLRQDPEQGIH